MEVKPGYTQTEVGIIPEKWHVRRFGDLCSVLRGGSPRPIQDYITNAADGINWIKIGDVDVGAKYIDKTAEKIIPVGALRSRHVRVGDFLLSNSMSFGRPYILRTEGCIHDGWLVIQGYESAFDTEYLYYHLSAEAVLTQYQRYAAGSGVLNLNKDVVSRIGVVVPPLSEQKAIAAALTDVDALLGALDRLIAKKRDLKQAAMQQLLTGQTRLPGFSGKWATMTLGDLGNWFSGGTPSKSNETYWSGDIPWVSPKDMKVARIIDAIDHVGPTAIGNGTRLLPTGAILIVVRGMILAHSAPVARIERPVAFNQDIKGLVVRSDIDSNFVLWWLVAHEALLLSLTNEATHGTKRIPTDELLKLTLLVPGLDEQAEVAGVVTDMDAELSALEQRRDKTRLLKQGMMQELLTGRTRLV